MSSINPQIDAAVVLMKARAAEYDEEREMDGVTAEELLDRAFDNLARDEDDSTDIIDCMNLCALALSVSARAEEGSEG